MSELDTNRSIGFLSTPSPVGFWVLYPGAPLETRFPMYVRPTDEQIRNTTALLGWGWKDAK